MEQVVCFKLRGRDTQMMCYKQCNAADILKFRRVVQFRQTLLHHNSANCAIHKTFLKEGNLFYCYSNKTKTFL